MWMQLLQGLAYALTAASAADQMATDTSSNIQTPGSPAGGASQPQAQQFFSQGQPTRAPNQPSPLVPETSPAISSQIGQLLAGTPTASLEKAEQPSNPAPQMAGNPTPAPLGDIGQQPGTNGLVGNLGNMADALVKVLPLLGMDDQRKGLTLGHAAGGQPGQNIFQLPQRQTLAQILASLPRTM